MNRFALSSLLLAAVLAAAAWGIHHWKPAFNLPVMLGGVGVLTAATLIAYGVASRPMHRRPQAFVGGVMGATFLKLAVCVAALMVYVFTAGKEVHKPTLFVLFGMYAAFEVLQTAALQRLARRPQ